MKVFIFTGNDPNEIRAYTSMDKAIADNPEEEFYSYWSFNSDKTEAWTTGAERIQLCKVIE